LPRKPSDPDHKRRVEIVELLYTLSGLIDNKKRQRWGLELKLLKRIQGLGIPLATVEAYLRHFADRGKPVYTFLSVLKDSGEALRTFLRDFPTGEEGSETRVSVTLTPQEEEGEVRILQRKKR